ncbi:hypothetical protein Tco_0515699, partial [Tanacetum coccineum]
LSSGGSRLLRTFNRNAEVVRLVLGELSELSSELFKMKCNHLLVKVLRQQIHPRSCTSWFPSRSTTPVQNFSVTD